MHDTLEYFARDPIHRRYHHDELTFSLVYAFTEQFVLPLSHDEVVHGKGSLLSRDARRRLAEARQPARALRLHVGAPRQEAALHGRRDRPGAGVEPRAQPRLAPARAARATPACSAWCATSTASTASTRRCGSSTPSRPGFRWLVVDDRDANVVAFARFSAPGARPLVAVANLSPVPRDRLPRCRCPRGGHWREVLNTRLRRSTAAPTWATSAACTPRTRRGAASRPRPRSLVPPLGVIWLTPDE